MIVIPIGQKEAIFLGLFFGILIATLIFMVQYPSGDKINQEYNLIMGKNIKNPKSKPVVKPVVKPKTDPKNIETTSL